MTIVSYARVAAAALKAADALANEGISAEVIDLRTIAPWDKKHRASIGSRDRTLAGHA
jgi:pyruvate/2-oxoglutarate/acetoin dehydrogenase E1 component